MVYQFSARFAKIRLLFSDLNHMKKILLSLLAFALLTPTALAATLYSEYETVADKFERQEMAPIMITSTSDADITTEHGIRLMLATTDDAHILWDDTQPGFVSGTAKDNGKIDLNVQVEFSEDYKFVFIPVKEDFVAGEWLNIIGLYVRAYNAKFEPKKLGMDLNGDMVADVEDINTYRVGNNVKTDLVEPYTVRDLTYEKNADGSVTFQWTLPLDYDYDGTAIDRERVKNGFTQLALVYDEYASTFTDTDLEGVTSATYFFYAHDWNGNRSEPVEVFIDFTAGQEESVEEPEEEPVTEPVEEPVADEDEVDELSRLLNYYNVRYSIKCMPSGVVVAENNSACLWARIDLIYAQDLTGEEKVPGLALSARDLELMATRRRWPEQRHEDNCVAVAEPAGYCPALGKALNRISYFLD